jgi:hypothetical protein
MSGLGRKTFELDLSKYDDKNIFVVIGNNASGKSTFLSLIHPTHIPSDGRTKFVIPGKEGSLIRIYKGDDGTILVSKCIYTPKHDESGHNAKCFLSIQRIGDDEPVELNPNGNVTSYTSLLLTYFGITKDYVNFASYSDAVSGIVSMTDSERKNNVSSLVPNTGRFELAYNTINDKYKELRNLMRNVAQKIMSIRDEDSLDADLKRITRELNEALDKQDEYIQKLGKAEGRIRELSHGNDIKQMAREYNDMVMSIATMDSRLADIKNRLYRLYDKLNLDIDPDNPVSFIGVEKLNSYISKYERKIGTTEGNIRTSSERLSKIRSEINRTENEIGEAESVLFSIQTQDVAELEKTRKGYLDQLQSLRYTAVKDQYQDMTYTECVAFTKNLSTLSYMIQALYDEYGDLVSQYFSSINEDTTETDMQSIDKLTVSIETKSTKKDAIYRALIEKEQYRKFQDILDQRPRTCHDDSCPFIANALKWAHVAGEIADLQEEYKQLDIEISNDQSAVECYEKKLALRQTAQNLLAFINSQQEMLSKYLKVSISDLYNAIAHGTWNDLLDILKVKKIAAILSEKDLYERITNQLIPDVERAIEVSKVYGTNRAILVSQLDRMKTTLQLLNDEYTEHMMAQVASTKMKDVYATKLQYWRSISDLLSEYKTIAEKQLRTTEDAKAREANIHTIADLVEKHKELDEKLDAIRDRIQELTPLKQQIQMDLAELLKLKAEKDQIDHDFMIVDIMRSIIQPGKGIRKELLNIYFYDIYQTANQLLLNTFDGKLRLHEFIITDKEFTIPFEYAGEIGSDVAFASSSQRATIAIAISLAIISKLVDKYSIVAFDESDQTLSPANKSIFVDIVSKQMKTVGITQSFIISHSPEYYESLDSVCFIGFPGYSDSINTKANDIIEV